MSNFKKLHTRPFMRTSPYVNTDNQYWKNYEFPVTVKEFSSIDFIDVSTVEPYYVAVTTGPKIDIYQEQTVQIWRSLTRFQRGAYGGKFRSDGQLLAAGSEEGQVRLFNFRQKQVLRIFKGHAGPVHRTDFVQNKPQLVSFSDDKTISLWDISGEKEVSKFAEHTDFIRAGAMSPVSENIVVSGSYDHSVKVWDLRTGSSVMTFDHGSPVQALVCYPSGSVIASAGGTEVKVWDAVEGKLLTSLSQHHKTITCLSLATNNTRLLSGSLDRHVKVYDLASYETLHAMDYPAPILSLGVAPEDSTLVTGMLSEGSGLVSFQHRVIKKIPEEVSKKAARKKKPIKAIELGPSDEIFLREERETLRTMDRYLAKFEFTRSIDFVLQSGRSYKDPHIAVSVMRELIRRDSLRRAVAGRDAKTLHPLTRFLIKYLRHPLFNSILLIVTETVIDLYEEKACTDSKILNQLSRLNEELEKDIEVTRSSIALMGTIEMLLATSSTPTFVSALDTPAPTDSQQTLSNGDSTPKCLSTQGSKSPQVVNVH